MSKTIELALKSAKTFDGDITTEREALTVEKARLAALHQNLLPVEVGAKTQIERQLNENEKKINLLDTLETLGNLPMLDLGVFAWTKPQRGWRKTFGWQMINVPVFAYIRVDKERCELRAERDFFHQINGNRHDSHADDLPVRDQYRNFLNDLSRQHLTSDRRSIRLTYTYPGMIPDHIKEIIRQETQGKRFTNLAFVCDVDHWQVGVTKSPPREFFDPILVGEKNDALWVLASFDPTPVEEYLLREFTS